MLTGRWHSVCLTGSAGASVHPQHARSIQLPLGQAAQQSGRPLAGRHGRRGLPQVDPNALQASAWMHLLPAHEHSVHVLLISSGCSDDLPVYGYTDVALYRLYTQMYKSKPLVVRMALQCQGRFRCLHSLARASSALAVLPAALSFGSYCTVLSVSTTHVINTSPVLSPSGPGTSCTASRDSPRSVNLHFSSLMALQY